MPCQRPHRTPQDSFQKIEQEYLLSQGAHVDCCTPTLHQELILRAAVTKAVWLLRFIPLLKETWPVECGCALQAHNNRGCVYDTLIQCSLTCSATLCACAAGSGVLVYFR